MSKEDEALQKMRQLVFSKVEHSVATTDDGFRHEVQDLLPLYLMFKVLDELEAMNSILSDEWDSRHNV